MRKVILYIIFFGLHFSAFAQDIDSLMSDYLNHPKRRAIPKQLYQSPNDKLFYKELVKKLNEEDVNLIIYFDALSILGRMTESTELKQNIVLKKLLFIEKKPYNGLTSLLGKELFLYPSEAFETEEIKDAIKRILSNPKYVPFQLFLVAGFVNDTRFEPLLEKQLNKPRWSSYWTSPEWGARLALARMGNLSQINYIVDTLTIYSNSQIINISMTNLLYVKHPKTYQPIIDILFSDNVFLTEDGEEEQYAVNALHQLTKSIQGFPVKTAPYRIYTHEDIIRARIWIKENPNYIINKKKF